MFNVARDECKELIKNGKFKYEGYFIQVNKYMNLNTITLETFGSISEGSCTNGGTLIADNNN